MLIDAKKDVHTFPVMETFETIQGEGVYQGHAAYFIRLAGCDVGCVWCDSKASWDATIHPKMTITNITKNASASKSRLVVITGGEPTMYDLTLLTQCLRETKKRLHIETSGVYPLTGEWDWITFSPKKYKKPHQAIYARANELKIVIYHTSDLKWAEQHACCVDVKCQLFLQPEWSRKEKILPFIIDYVKQYPQWTISVQLHKYLGIS